MEGQGFNPTPTPALMPGQPSQPQAPADTVEPVAQDSFAQPMAAGVSWQPEQATAPQVGGLNVSPTATVPEPAPEPKSNKGLLIGIIVAAVALVGLVACIVMVLVNGGNSTAGSETASNADDERLEQMKIRRNLQRESDIKRFLLAVSDYQANNSGVTPFGNSYNKEKIGRFVSRYIDQNVDAAGVEEGEGMICSPSCAQFYDPDGTIYGWTVDAANDGAVNAPIAYGGDGHIDHIIHVYVYADCGTDNGTYTRAASVRNVALFYIAEGKIICGDLENGIANPTEEESGGNSNMSVQERNNTRDDDVARLLTAVNDYQTNNNGNTPFSDGVYNKNKVISFVRRYIDQNVNNPDENGGSEAGQPFSCRAARCPNFTDPDGTMYGFTVDLAESGAKDKKIKYSITNGVDHMFHIYVNASCGAGSGNYSVGSSKRQIAVFYVGEDGYVICNDNH